MASTPLVAPRAATAQPDPSTTNKQQKGFQLDDDYNAQQVNQEFDRIHERINAIVTAAAALADLTTLATGATLPEAVTAIQAAQARLNAFGAILRQSGLLKSS